MQDMKLFTEICHALENGVTTTNKNSLDGLYRRYDSEDSSICRFENALVAAMDIICTFKFIAGTQLAKAHVLYALVLAVMNSFTNIPNRCTKNLIDLENLNEVEMRLCDMADALDLDESEIQNSIWCDFIDASSSRTNVKSQREKRIDAFEKALLR